MALQDNALITLQQIKDKLGITDTSEDEYLESLINSISDDFEFYCSRSFKQEVITDYELPGTDRQAILLPKRPIQSIQNVYINDEELDTKANDEYFGYYIADANAGKLARQAGWFVEAYINNPLEFQQNNDMKILTIK